MEREKFSSRLGFILISAGCAIGLGNVYRFPIWCGAYGGGVFLLFYILFLIIFGMPIMTMELAVGRASRASIANSFDVLEKPGQKWHLWKYAGIGGNYLLMAFYAVIAGWFCIYFWRYLDGSMLAVGETVDIGVFVEMITDGKLNYLVGIGVVIAGFAVCALGLQKGVEKVTKFMMIALFVLMIGLAVYACTMPGVKQALKFYLVPDWQRAKEYGLGKVINAAMTQTFFTLSLGIGSIAIFGSYIDKDRSLLGEGLTIILLDTLVALIAGFIIFPAYFTFNPTAEVIGADAAGATFLFTTLSSIFNNMAGGRIIGSLFFLFMIFAAMSTVIAVFENIVSFWLEDTKLDRKKTVLINFAIFLVIIIPFVLDNCGIGVFTKKIWLGKGFGDFEDFLVSNVALPVGCLVYTLFCSHSFGWGWDNFINEVDQGTGLKFPKWSKPYIKWIMPVLLLVVVFLFVFG